MRREKDLCIPLFFLRCLALQDPHGGREWLSNGKGNYQGVPPVTCLHEAGMAVNAAQHNIVNSLTTLGVFL